MGADNPEDEEEKPKKLTKAMAENMFDQIMNDEGGIWEREKELRRGLYVIADLGLNLWCW